MTWAKGLIDNEFTHYILDDGMVRYRGEELPQSARMLTILALYYSYSEDAAAAASFLLDHFDRAKAVADLFVMRRGLTLNLSRTDPRCEENTPKPQLSHPTPPLMPLRA